MQSHNRHQLKNSDGYPKHVFIYKCIRCIPCMVELKQKLLLDTIKRTQVRLKRNLFGSEIRQIIVERLFVRLHFDGARLGTIGQRGDNGNL